MLPSPLDQLRRTLAGLDLSLGPKFADEERLIALSPPIDRTLGGGLPCGALHELAPTAPMDLAAASGFALSLSVLAGRLRTRAETLLITTDFAAGEVGAPYAPGLDRFGFMAARLLVLRVPRPADVFWAMEEALRCRTLGCVIAELTGETADLTTTRRLALAARDGGGLGLILHHRVSTAPAAAATRWRIAPALSRPDRFGGLGLPRFDLTLTKNRSGPSGRWIIEWDHHEHVFRPAVSVGVAAAAFDRPDRAPLVRAG